MAARSFWIGLPVGMIGLSILGAMLRWRLPGDAATVGQRAGQFPRGMWLGMVLVTIPIAVAAFRGHFHDVLLANGHMAFVSEIQNNYFPAPLFGVHQRSSALSLRIRLHMRRPDGNDPPADRSGHQSDHGLRLGL